MTEILSTMVALKFVVLLFSKSQLHFIETLQACRYCSPDKSRCGGSGLSVLALYCCLAC